MTFEQFVGVRNCDIDIETGNKLTHSEIYQRAIERFGGLDAIIPFIPFSNAAVKHALANGDENLNTLNIKEWDGIAGYYFKSNFVFGPIWNLYRRYGVTAASSSQGVCLLKEAARMRAERRKANGK